MTEVTPNLPHCGNFCKYCFMGTLLPKALLPTLIEEQIKSSSNDISLEKGIESKKVYDILERKWMSTDPEDEYTTTSVKYRAEEYEALNGEVSFPTGDGGDFVREATDISAYKIPYIKSICRIVLGGDFSDFVTRWHPMGR